MTTTRKSNSSIFPLPSAKELAQLAATLAPHDSPNAAIEKAMEFYVEAVLIARELPLSEKEIILKFGTEARRLRLFAEPSHKVWETVLILGPEKSANDEVREFLRERGLELKKPRSVIQNIRRYWGESQGYWEASFRMTFDELLTRCARSKDGKKTFAIPRHLLESLADYAKALDSEKRRKSWNKRRSTSK